MKKLHKNKTFSKELVNLNRVKSKGNLRNLQEEAGEQFFNQGHL